MITALGPETSIAAGGAAVGQAGVAAGETIVVHAASGPVGVSVLQQAALRAAV